MRTLVCSSNLPGILPVLFQVIFCQVSVFPSRRAELVSLGRGAFLRFCAAAGSRERAKVTRETYVRLLPMLGGSEMSASGPKRTYSAVIFYVVRSERIVERRPVAPENAR